MLLPEISDDEFRQRVREAGALLRVAQQYARDARDDVAKSEHASARIQAICREVQDLLPAATEPSAIDPGIQEALDGLHRALPIAQSLAEAEAVTEADAADAGADEDVGGATDEQDEQAEGEDGQVEAEDEQAEGEEEAEDEEWDLDYAKLASAIDSDALMAPFPEPERSLFRRAARYLIESHQRQELFQTVVDQFDELSALTQANVEDTQQKLALALTLENLAVKRLD